MNIKELKKEKIKAERELSRIIHGEVVKFYEKTGVWPDSSSIYYTPVKEFGKEDYVDMIVEVKHRLEV